MPNLISSACSRRSRATVAGVLLTIATVAATPASLGAATPALKCTGPSPTEQAGRQTIAPGINGHATVQTVTSKVHLFKCDSGKTKTGGSGMLRTSLTTGAVTCSVFTTAHVWKPTATIRWKNDKTSTVKLSFTTSGASRRAQVTGTVTKGLFAGLTVTAEFRWVPVISPGTEKVPAACANKVAFGGDGRVSIVGDTVFRTTAFTIN